MKILVVTNLYPPHHIGGYELGCHDVVQELRARGHDVRVLTSTFGCTSGCAPPDEKGVTRILQFNVSSSDPSHDKLKECLKIRTEIRAFSPQVVYFWNQAGLSFWLPFIAQSCGSRIAFFLSDTNFVSWRVAAWLVRFARRSSLVRFVFGATFLVRGWPVIQGHPCHFASQFLRHVAEREQIQIDGSRSTVIHWGLNLSAFPAPNRTRGALARILYVGQLIPQKGVHTAIVAMGLLAAAAEFKALELTIVGGGMMPDYEKELRALPAQSGIGDRVHFLGKIPRADLPAVYARHDILVFPSEWEEPFAITPLEAMASGLVVVGTTTGGSGELLRNRETAMTFAAGDAGDCARAIRELCTDRALAESIRDRAQNAVATRYTLESMVDCIEASLQDVAEPPPSH